MCCAPFLGDGFVMKVQPCSSASSANTGSKHTVLITHYLTSYHLLQQGAAAQLQGGALSLATEVSGLGPLFRLRATLHNHGKGALRDLLVVVQPPAAVYALPEGAQRGVPLLLPLTHLSLVRPCCSLPGSKRMISTQKSILCTKPKKKAIAFLGVHTRTTRPAHRTFRCSLVVQRRVPPTCGWWCLQQGAGTPC